MKRVAITGTRVYVDAKALEGDIYLALGTLDPIGDKVILGDAKGVDTIARRACHDLKLYCIVKKAEWKRYGKGAGPIRNGHMLDEQPDEVWYFHPDLESSAGTKNCTNQARERGIEVRNGSNIA